MKKYTIERSGRNGPNGVYFVWLLVELDLPDKNGIYQQEKVIADFGNTKSIANTLNVKMVKQLFENRAFWE